MRQSWQRPERLFYGWYIVAAVLAVTFVASGSVYSFGVFFEPLRREFMASRTDVSLVFSAAAFLFYVCGAVSGPLSERLGARAVTVAGMVLTGVGLLGMGLAPTLEQVYLAFGLGVGLGVGMAFVPALGTVQRWFVRQRGFASGLAVSGSGLGILIMPPLAGELIALWSWRAAYLIMATLAVAVGAGMALLIRNDPRQCGMFPDGDDGPATGFASAAVGVGLGEAMATSAFQWLYLACFLSGLGAFVALVHLAPFAVDQGLSEPAAAWLVGAIGVGNVSGRLFLGQVADRLGRPLSLLVVTLGLALATPFWAVSSSFASLAVFAVVYGVFLGGWVAILPSVVADLFGVKSVSSIIGVLYTSVAVGTLIGPWSMGYLVDRGAGYTLVIVANGLCLALASLVTLRLWRLTQSAHTRRISVSHGVRH